MPDQAAGLRGLFARRRPSLVVVAGDDPAKARVAVRLAREAARSGRVTLLVDATPGRVAAACATACRYELSHVAAGDVGFADVVRVLSPQLLVLPAARAVARFADFTAVEHARLAEAFSGGLAALLASLGVDAQVDLVVVHAEDGEAARAVEAFGRDARIVVVASHHGASLRGAYTELKALSLAGLEHFEIVAPQLDEPATHDAVFANLAAAASRFLTIELVDGGVVATDSDEPGIARTPQAIPLHSLTEEEVPHAAAA